MTKKIQIKLSPNGEITMETKGIKGKKCLAYADLFKKLANVKITDTKLSQEYYESETDITNQEVNEIKIDF